MPRELNHWMLLSLRVCGKGKGERGERGEKGKKEEKGKGKRGERVCFIDEI